EEVAQEAGQAIVVAILVAGVGAGDRLVGLRRGDLERGAPGDAAVSRGLVPDVGLLAVRVVDRVVVHDADPAAVRVDRQPRVELVVLRRRVVELDRRRPGRAAVGRAGEPDAGLAGRGGVGARLVGRRGAAGLARQVGPRGVDVAAEGPG